MEVLLHKPGGDLGGIVGRRAESIGILLGGEPAVVVRRGGVLLRGEEAVQIYRGLAAANPDAFLPNLASSLNNQSGWLSELGRREDALATIEEGSCCAARRRSRSACCSGVCCRTSVTAGRTSEGSSGPRSFSAFAIG